MKPTNACNVYGERLGVGGSAQWYALVYLVSAKYGPQKTLRAT